MKKLFFFFLVLIFISVQASARVYILIDQASDKKFPIAVPEFVTSNGGSAGGTASGLVELIQKDLTIADMFQVLDDSLLPQSDRDTTEINFAKWQALEVGALVKGVVSKGEGGQKIQIRLYDVPEKTMILGKEYIVTSQNMVATAHKFVDDLMKALTGVRGPFHSQLVASCGARFKRRLAYFQMDSSKAPGGYSSGGTNPMSPAFSPDGSQIAYTSFVKSPKSEGNVYFPEIFVDGKRVTNLNSTTLTPDWTPDGGSLIISSAISGDSELYQVSLSGKIIRQITRTPNIEVNPAISNDGRMLFASERSGGLQIFVSPMGGGGASQVTYTGYQNDQPQWSPDGQKITFCGRDQGTFDVFVMNADGSNILRVTRGEGSNESPVWSPDSRYIAFHSTMGGVFVVREEAPSRKTLIQKSASCDNLDWGPWLSE